MLEDIPQSTATPADSIPLQSANNGDVLNSQTQQTVLVSGGGKPTDTDSDYSMFIVFALIVLVVAVGIYMVLPRSKN